MNKKIAITAIIVVAVVSVIILTVFSPGEDLHGASEDRVAVINLQGNIGEGATNVFTGGITPQYVESQLEKVSRNNTIEAVVLRINSPGGSIGSSQEIASMVDNYEKPVVISMGDVAASGGYYISAPADGIVAKPGTLTGSIGVINVNLNMEDLYDMLGIDVEIIKSGKHKDMSQRAMTEEERRLMQDLSDEAYNQFIDEIVRGRNLDEEAVRELATGELFLGSQAAEHGLIDRLGGLDEAIQYAGEIAGLENPVKYELPQPSFFEMLTQFSVQIPEMVSEFLTPAEVRMIEMLDQVPVPELRYQSFGEELKK